MPIALPDYVNWDAALWSLYTCYFLLNLFCFWEEPSKVKPWKRQSASGHPVHSLEQFWKGKLLSLTKFHDLLKCQIEVFSAHLNSSGLQRSPSWKKVLVSLLTQSSSWQESTTLNWGAFPVVRDIEADKEEDKAKICRAADMIGIKRRSFFFVTFLQPSLMLMIEAIFFVEQKLFCWPLTKRQ